MSYFTDEQREEIVRLILDVINEVDDATPEEYMAAVPPAAPLEVNPEDEDPDPRRPFIFKVLGIKSSPPPVIEREDGSKFQAYPRQRGDDWYWIELGVSDVTATPWNSYDINYKYSDKTKAKNLRTYSGGLRQKLSDWPEDKRATFLEGHPNWGNDSGSKK